MLPPRIATLLDRIREQIASNKPERSEHQHQIPVEYYFSNAQYEAEKSILFSRYPLIVTHSYMAAIWGQVQLPFLNRIQIASWCW